MDRPEREKWTHKKMLKGKIQLSKLLHRLFSLLSSPGDTSSSKRETPKTFQVLNSPLTGPFFSLLYTVTLPSPVSQGSVQLLSLHLSCFIPGKNVISQNKLMILPCEFMRQKWGSDQNKLNVVSAPLCTLQIDKQGSIKEKDQNKCLKLCHSLLHP